MPTTSTLPGTLVHPAKPGSRRFTAEDLWNIPRVGAPVPAPDGRTVVVPVTTYRPGEKSGRTRLWLVPVDGGDARPLTSEDATCGIPRWSPDGTRLAYTRKAVGDDDAKPQLHVLPLDGGEGRRVTDMPLGVLDAQWMPDGAGLVVASKVIVGHVPLDATRAEIARRKDDPLDVHVTEARLYRFWDTWLDTGEVPHLFHVDPGGAPPRDLTPGSTAWFDFMDPTGQFDIAPDGRSIVYAAFVVDDHREEIVSRIFRVGLDGGPVACLTPDAPAWCGRPRFTPDGGTIVYGRSEDRYFYADRARIRRRDVATGADEPWCTEWDFDPNGWELDRHGRLVFTAQADARSHLYVLHPGASEPSRLAEGGAIGAPRPTSDGHVVFTMHHLSAPPEAYRVPIDGGEPQRLTAFTDEALRDVALGAVHEIRVTGAGGEPVQSYVVLPPDHDPSKPAPLVNLVHGGPHGTNGDDFHFRWNVHLFCAPGYVAVTPNFQGSTSWGTDYARRIQGAWAERPFADVMAVTDAIVETGLVDAERMAAAGGSYGGYMMAWIAGHTDRFRCLVNHAGVYNTLAMGATDITQGRHRSFGGEPWDGLDAIDRCNPARCAAGMVTPMLVIHGERDYRVPVDQGLECYNLLKAKGVPARLVYYPGENHWVLQRENSLRWYAEVHGWLQRWLGA